MHLLIFSALLILNHIIMIFEGNVHELQRCQTHYPEILTLLLRQLFILIRRQLTREHTRKDAYLEEEMSLAMQFFNDNYNTEVNIEEYASAKGMSPSDYRKLGQTWRN